MKKTLTLLLSLILLMCVMVGCGGESTPEAPEAPAAAAEVTWESYLNWICDTFGADSPDPDAYRALIFQAESWDDIDVNMGPWDRLFGEDFFNASTWDEFVAAGGVGTYNEEFQDDALTGSGEPTGEASGEPAA